MSGEHTAAGEKSFCSDQELGGASDESSEELDASKLAPGAPIRAHVTANPRRTAKPPSMISRKRIGYDLRRLSNPGVSWPPRLDA